MGNDSIIDQVLLELVLQQSYEGTAEQIIRRMLPMYMRKLNCFLAAVIAHDDTDTVVPLAIREYPLWRDIKTDLAIHREGGNTNLLEREYSGDFVLFYPMHDYGWLILGKKQPLGLHLKNELKSVVNQFGRTLCFSTEEERLKLFQSLINNSSDGFQVATEDGRLYYINDQSAKRLGIDQANVHHYRVSDFEKLFAQPGAWEAHVSELQQKPFITVNGFNRNQTTGETFPVEVTVKYITIGGRGFVIANSRDISERIQSTEQLRLLQERLELAIEGSNDGIWDWDITTNKTFFSKRWKGILGYEDHELENNFDTFARLIYEADLPHVTSYVTKYLNGDVKKYEIDFRMKHKDGSLRWITAKGAAIRNAEGLPYRMSGSHTDVTERKKNEQELLSTKELLEQTSQIARIGGYSFDAATQELYWSPVTCEIHEVPHGFKPSVDEAIRFYKEGASRDSIQAMVQATISQGASFDLELQIVTAKGNERWVRAIGKPEYRDGVLNRFYGTVQDIDNAKQKSLELVQTKQQLESIFNEMEDVVWSIQLPEFKTVFLTPSAEKMCGIPTQKLMQTRWWWQQMVHPDDASTLSVIEEQLLHTGSYVIKHRIITAQGDVKWLHNHGKIVYSQEGLPIRLDGIATDRTGQFEAEEQLTQEVSLQQILIDVSSTYINIKLEEVGDTIQKSLKELGEFVKADRSYIFDYDLVAQTTSNTYEWCAPGIEPEIHNLQQVPLNAIPQWIEKHLSGEPFFLPDISELPDDGPNGLRAILEPQGIKSLITIPMVDQDGLMGFVGFDSVRRKHHYSDKERRLLFLYAEMLINVRNRQKHLQSLTLQEEKYRNIIANMNLGLLEESVDNTIVFANHSFCTTSGYTQAELVGKRVTDLFYATSFQEPMAEMARKRASGVSQTIETMFINKRGERRWWFVSSAPNYNDKGQLVGYIGIYLDITEQKKLQEEQKLLISLTQSQNDRLKNFAHIVSHNLRSHSINIKALMDFLFEAKPELRDFELTQLMKQASDNLLDTIGHLSEVAIMNTNEQRQLTQINLSETVEKAIGNVAALAMNSNVQIMNDLSASIHILGIPAYMDSVVLNLLTNAIKYRSPERDSFVHVSGKVEKQYFVLSVADNGLGIDLHRHGKKLFGMYKTFHSHEDSRGVGLFMTKNQVEAMGGRIEVISEVNSGTTFKIYLQHEKN